MYEWATTVPVTDKGLNLIMEEFERPMYVVSESTGNAYLLEDALFMEESQIISEGIMDSIVNKVKGVYEKIKEGILKAITSGAEIIKSFCEKIMNSRNSQGY